MPTPLLDGIPVSPQQCFKMLVFCVVAEQFGIIKTIPLPNGGVEPKPATKTDNVEIFWDIPIYSSGAEIY